MNLAPPSQLFTQSLMQNATTAELERLQAFARRWNAYFGRFKPPLIVKRGQPNDNVSVNLCRAIVDKSVAFLFGRDLTFAVAADDDVQPDAPPQEDVESPVDDYLDAVWRLNRRQTVLQKLALNGSVTGHAFLKIRPQQAPALPRLEVLDPATVTVRWAPDDIDTVVYYRIQYTALDPRTAKPINIRQTIEQNDGGQSWTITDLRNRPDSSVWEVVGVTVWPYPFAPICHCQNRVTPNEFWGLSDLEDDIINVNYALNFNLSARQRIDRFYAHPWVIGKGMGESQMKRDVDQVMLIPTDADIRYLEMQSELAGSDQLFVRLKELFYEVTRVPEVAAGKLEQAGNLSGVALQVLYQPLLELTAGKRMTYGDMLIDLNKRLLTLAGLGDDIETVIEWPEILPVDTTSEANTALLWQGLGVSQTTILRRLGFDPTAEAAQRAEDAAQEAAAAPPEPAAETDESTLPLPEG